MFYVKYLTNLIYSDGNLYQINNMIENLIIWLVQFLGGITDKILYLAVCHGGRYVFFMIGKIAKQLASKNLSPKGGNDINQVSRLNALILEMDESLEELLGDKRECIQQLTESGATEHQINKKHFDYCLAIIGVFFVRAVKIYIYGKVSTTSSNIPKHRRKP